MITLRIDTSDSRNIRVGLQVGWEKYYLSSATQTLKAQVVLPLIEQLLKQQSHLLEDVSRIQVETRPGSYTGIKVGISVANALSLSLLKPVNNKRVGEIEIPSL